MSQDRLPPHSVEAEQGILGCILLDPNESLPMVIEAFGTDPSVFYDLRHQSIYSCMCDLWDLRDPIELVSMRKTLSDRGELESVGGVAYLAELPDKVPSAANLDYYVNVARECLTLRRVLATCSEAIAKIHNRGTSQVDDLVDSVERSILGISSGVICKGYTPIKQLAHQVIDTMDAAMQSGGAIRGLPTGFPDLDVICNGMAPSEMIVLAGRPSAGKTSFAMNIAEHVAVERGQSVGIFSLEMSGEEIVRRMFASQSRVSLTRILRGCPNEGDIPKLTGAAVRIGKSKLHIFDESDMTIAQIRAKARRMTKQFDIKLWVIDYLQLVGGAKFNAKSRAEEVQQVSSGLKAMAKELGVPVIALSQLNRDSDRDKNRKPRLSDLRESGAIEQDADKVWMLYRAETDEEIENNTGAEVRPINLLVAKNRNGAIGDVHLVFLATLTKFESASKVSSYG